ESLDVGEIDRRGKDMRLVRSGLGEEPIDRGENFLGLLADASTRGLVGNLAEEIALADLDAAEAQDVVCGGQVKIEIGQDEMEEIVGALHFHRVGRPDGKDDLAIAAGLE